MGNVSYSRVFNVVELLNRVSRDTYSFGSGIGKPGRHWILARCYGSGFEYLYFKNLSAVYEYVTRELANYNRVGTLNGVPRQMTFEEL